jgi:ABC-type lipoprotein release transport system permease subunit
MTAPLLFVLAQLRGRWRGWLALSLLVGLFAGAVVTVAAGAQRTGSAYPRLLAWSNAPDATVLSPLSQSRTFAVVRPRQIARLPQVTGAAIAVTYSVANPAAIVLIAPEDNRIPGQMWSRKMLAGRLPDPASPDEADISFTVARQFRLGVGGTLSLGLLTLSGTTRNVRLRVVGVDAAAGEFPPGTGTGTDTVWTTPAFYRQHAGQPFDGWEATVVRLRHGAADWPGVQHEVERRAHGRVLQGFTMADTSESTERSIHLQVVALRVLAALLALIGLLVAGQLITRLTVVESGDYRIVQALGMTRRQLAATALGRAVLIGVTGGLAGVVLAVALSPLFPIGLASFAEPHPGIDADAAVLAIGLCATLAGVVACAAWPAWRLVRRSPDGQASARPATGPVSALASGLRPVSAAIGLRLALQRGSGRTALPVVTTVVTAAVGLAALAAALVFSESLNHLLSTPRLYGASWDVLVQSAGSEQGQGVTAAVPVVAHDRQVAAWAIGYSGVPLRVGTAEMRGIALEPGHGGTLQPTIVRGRLPRAGEIALGERTLASLHAHLGETVSVALADGPPRAVRIVGIAILPTLSDQLTLGTGAAFSVDELKHLAPPRIAIPVPDTLVVRLRPGADPQVATARLAAGLQQRGPFVATIFQTPADLLNFGGVGAMPTLLGIMLGVLALATIAHLLITSVRRRRRDLAVLRTIGFTRRQVRAAVAWQAATLTVVALAIGIPAGIIGGRITWLAFTRQIGVLPVLRVPLLAFAMLVPAALILALAVSALPGESAARTRPAGILRSE